MSYFGRGSAASVSIRVHSWLNNVFWGPYLAKGTELIRDDVEVVPTGTLQECRFGLLSMTPLEMA